MLRSISNNLRNSNHLLRHHIRSTNNAILSPYNNDNNSSKQQQVRHMALQKSQFAKKINNFTMNFNNSMLINHINKWSFSSSTSALKRRKRRPLRAPINVTENAANRIKEIIGDKGDIDGVRLGVRTRGCNGMSYTMNYVEKNKVELLDEKVEEHGVRVYIDTKAMFHLIGTTMDYKEDEISAEFTFENPNATGMCGCGESFSVGDSPPPLMQKNVSSLGGNGQ
jgi:iron-sulfur cluster assembly 1